MLGSSAGRLVNALIVMASEGEWRGVTDWVLSPVAKLEGRGGKPDESLARKATVSGTKSS